jgi:hypothetical protein
MEKDDEIRDLMGKLMEAVEASLSTSTEVRAALADLVRNGYEARLFFVANAEAAEAAESSENGDAVERSESEDDGSPDESAAPTGDEEETYVVREIGAVADGGDLRFELTKLDRDFLKSLHIRPENG